MKLNKGCIQVYTGDGKGKTTAALGQALRALGHGLKVFVIQFMKGNIEYGELEMSRRLAPQFTLKQMGRETFVNKKNPDPKDIEMAKDALKLAQECMKDKSIDILILDEINVAIDFKLIPLDEVLAMLGGKPEQMELILTGRAAAQELIDKADLVTEMKEVKHYYRNGIEARVGIER
ncbi:MAG: cob(I)yrinic acid a,c-diamide adenosyltransferase [Pseudomonadota bacterium]